LDVDNLVEKLNVLDDGFKISTTSDDYIEVMEELVKLSVPFEIREAKSGSLPYFAGLDEIELNSLKNLGAGSYSESRSSDYKNAIVGWAGDNLEMSLDFKNILVYYEKDIDDLLWVYELELKPKRSLGETYLVIKGTGIEFDKTYDTEEFNESTGITFEDLKSTKTVKFALSDTGVESLEFFLSPKFSELEVDDDIEPCNFNDRCEEELGETWRNCRSDCKPWGIVIILLVILFFFAVIAYMLLQWWYKINYERLLFKNRNDVYNLTNFISNARSQGMGDKEIFKKLRERGWKREQINYIFKKMKGKAIMPFDFVKLFKKEGVKKAVESREGIKLPPPPPRVAKK
jgi:hypothetical protein